MRRSNQEEPQSDDGVGKGNREEAEEDDEHEEEEESPSPPFSPSEPSSPGRTSPFNGKLEKGNELEK